MRFRTQIAKLVGQISLAPLSLFKSPTIANLTYRKSLKMLIENNVSYSLDAGQAGRALPEFYRPAEAFEVRFQQVTQAAKDVTASNLLDIGCAEGYMIRRAAKELGLFAVGLEMDRRRIRVGHAQSDLDSDTNYGIIPGQAKPDLLRQLPKFDVVVCFSVLHHVVRFDGLDGAMEFLKAIRQITRHRFLFDMGNPEETANDPEWGNVLSFLKGDVAQKNKELLESAGFTAVTQVGETPGFVQTATRPLFVCSTGESE